MDSDRHYLAGELELLRNDYANIRKLVRAYIRGEISHSGLVLDFAVESLKHDMRYPNDD